jgi:hypothetical protein
MAINSPQIDGFGGAAAWAEHVKPWHAGDQRGPDRRRLQHVPAKGKLIVPALDDGLCLGACRPVGGVALEARLHVESPCPHRHDALTCPCGPSWTCLGAVPREPAGASRSRATLCRNADLRSTCRPCLPEQVGEGLVGEFLEILHAISPEQVESVPGLLIELNALAWHSGYSSSSGGSFASKCGQFRSTMARTSGSIAVI